MYLFVIASLVLQTKVEVFCSKYIKVETTGGIANARYNNVLLVECVLYCDKRDSVASFERKTDAGRGSCVCFQRLDNHNGQKDASSIMAWRASTPKKASQELTTAKTTIGSTTPKLTTTTTTPKTTTIAEPTITTTETTTQSPETTTTTSQITTTTPETATTTPETTTTPTTLETTTTTLGATTTTTTTTTPETTTTTPGTTTTTPEATTTTTTPETTTTTPETTTTTPEATTTTTTPETTTTTSLATTTTSLATTTTSLASSTTTTAGTTTTTIFPPDLATLSLSKPTTISTTANNIYAYKAVDNNLNTLVTSDHEDYPWLLIDLEATAEIFMVDITFQYYYNHGIITVGNDTVHLSSRCANVVGAERVVTTRFLCQPMPIIGRYVRLGSAIWTKIGIIEMHVIGRYT